VLVETMHGMVDELRAEFMDRETQYSPEWQQAVGLRQDVLHLSPAELTDVRARIGAILAEYRRLRPQDQSPGARRVHAIVEFLPWFSPDAEAPEAGERPAAAGSPGEAEAGQ
jgi:hypothetical protein